MKIRRIVGLWLMATLVIVAVSGYAHAQESDENSETGAVEDLGPPPPPDEEIGDAVADPSQMLDATLEPDASTVEEVLDLAGDVEPAEADEVVAGDAVLSNGVPVQGRVATSAGAPLHGSYDIRLALYTVASGGTAVCSDTDTVNVVNGLFASVLNGCSTSDISGQQLYLGITVGTDPEMTPRQPIFATPYAHSLRPDAIVENTGSGHGLTVKSAGSGLANSALVADNTNTTSGVAFRAIARGDDAAIVSSSTGTGAIFKGFGGDGGEDEVRINNDGSLQVKQDSYLWIPGDAFIKNNSSDSTSWDIQNNGAARLRSGGVPGSKYIYFPITLPSVLYGQPVEVERITVYYRCQNGANNYIFETYMYKQTDADSAVTLIAHAPDHTSNVASSYTLNLTSDDRYLSAGQGALGLNLGLSFANNTDYIQIAGIRVQLGHHDLY
jgi:hypothetical protein